MSFEIESENPVVRQIIERAVPRPAQIAAARGVLPLPHADLLEVLVSFAGSDDAELASSARETLSGQDAHTLIASIKTNGVSRSVLDFYALQESTPKDVRESIVTNAKTPAATIVQFAKQTSDSDLIELISLNQQLLIQTPAIIDAIIANPHRTSEAERRAAETKREFFEKERGIQQIAAELRAQGKEAAAEFVEQAEFASDDDAIFLAQFIEVPDSETDDSWLGLEYIEEMYEETDAQRQAIMSKILSELTADEADLSSERVSALNRIMRMGMKDRVKLAMKGDREARNILIRDPNRIVVLAVFNNPKITEQEIEKLAAMRTAPEEVLRSIANSRQWSRSYSVVHNIARNPRAPIANVLTILSRLQLKDLTALSGNKNVSDAVRRQALRLSQSRRGK
jgi:arsenate reductase-like glutaredoxin family protein